MKAEEIRQLNVWAHSEALKTKTPGAQEAAMESIKVSLLAEIAAQLAEMNEHLAKIANPPMVVRQGEYEFGKTGFREADPIGG